VNLNVTADGLLELQAGTLPSLKLAGNASGNGQVSENGSANLTDETHSMSAEIKVAQTVKGGIEVNYSVTQDGKSTQGAMTFKTNRYGQCVISNPNNG